MKREDNGKNTKRLSKTVHIAAIQRRQSSGQVILEFTFCMIVVLLMIFGVAKVFFWTGKDLADRRKAHDDVLYGGGGPQTQIAPSFYTSSKMNAIWRGN